MQALQNLALRKVLGTFRSSPTIPSEVEAALPPPAVRLNTALLQYAFRARKLPPCHPVPEAIQQLQATLHSDSEDSDYSNCTQQRQREPPTQLERIVQSI
jgi:hypothetical protein